MYQLNYQELKCLLRFFVKQKQRKKIQLSLHSVTVYFFPRTSRLTNFFYIFVNDECLRLPNVVILSKLLECLMQIICFEGSKYTFSMGRSSDVVFGGMGIALTIHFHCFGGFPAVLSTSD